MRGKGRRSIDLSWLPCFARRLRLCYTLRSLKRIVACALSGDCAFIPFPLDSIRLLGRKNRDRVFYRGYLVSFVDFSHIRRYGGNTPFCGESLKSDCNFPRFVVLYSCDIILIFTKWATLGIGVSLFSHLVKNCVATIKGYILCGRSLNWERSFFIFKKIF